MGNEAAERLLLKWLNDVTFALDAERKATVNRIKVEVLSQRNRYLNPSAKIRVTELLAILDAEVPTDVDEGPGPLGAARLR